MPFNWEGAYNDACSKSKIHLKKLDINKFFNKIGYILKSDITFDDFYNIFYHIIDKVIGDLIIHVEYNRYTSININALKKTADFLGHNNFENYKSCIPEKFIFYLVMAKHFDYLTPIQSKKYYVRKINKLVTKLIELEIIRTFNTMDKLDKIYIEHKNKTYYGKQDILS